jgi:hypothetical protein
MHHQRVPHQGKAGESSNSMWSPFNGVQNLRSPCRDSYSEEVPILQEKCNDRNNR